MVTKLLKKYQALAKKSEYSDSGIWLVRMKISTTTQEDHSAVPANVNPEILYLRVYSTEINESVHQKTCQRIFKA